ncbi:MAG: hypothetical protein GWN00_35235 [Aliifodinibius sp.]|nr:transporter [Fodinibius sp.]NIV15898.1 hypothetical protein [Fodinibius sp.]NIY29853.1 hypothetical protein [Fodinibius sp.]
MSNNGFIWKSITFALIIHGLLIRATSNSVSAQTIRYNGSIQYATGSYYFTERTSSFYFNNGISISGNSSSISLSIPFITQNTPWLSNVGTGILPTGGPKNGMVGSNNSSGSKRRGNRKIDLGMSDTLSYTEANFGDPSLSVSIEVLSTKDQRTTISASGGIKFPLANAQKGFGTGEWDWGGGLSWSQYISSKIMLLTSGMFWKLGDMTDLDFNDIITYSAAIGKSFREGKWMGIISFSGITQIIDNVDPPLSVGTGINLQTSDKVSLNSNFTIGLTESASDVSIGVGWNLKL